MSQFEEAFADEAYRVFEQKRAEWAMLFAFYRVDYQ